MKNKLTDLNDHLFAQLERLGDEDMKPEQIEVEVKRATAIVSVANQIVGNAMLQVKAAALMAEHGSKIGPYLPAITDRSGKSPS